MKIIDKITSRKFLVWIVWTVLMFCTLSSLALTIPWYGIITMIYVGGNIASKYLEKK